MHVLIVFAHEEPKSFNGALKDSAVRVFKDQGHTVMLSDLYAMKWNAVACAETDIVDYEKPKFIKYQVATRDAFHVNKLAPDIVAEQEKVKKADLVLFVFPWWWFSVPAILKGWFDRVFTMGFAYSGGVGMYDTGPFKGKKAILCFTTGGPQAIYSDAGLNGFDVLKPEVVYGPARLLPEERASLLKNWEDRLEKIFEEDRLNFIETSQFEGGILKNPSAVSPTIGQHLGKPLPAGGMGVLSWRGET